MPEIRERIAARQSLPNPRVAEFEEREALRVQREREQRRSRLRLSSGVPKMFEAAAIERVDVVPGNSDGVHAAAFVVEQSFKASLALHGSDSERGQVGNSKTTLACAIVNAATELLIPAKFTRACSLFDDFLEASKYSSDESVVEIQQHLSRINVLVIDDLGRERLNKLTLPWLYELLDRRWAECRPLIVTTNLSFDQLYERYAAACKASGEPDSTANGIVDRLRGLIPIDRWVQVTGQSRRGR
jgi:DNA replication protein DnaC